DFIVEVGPGEGAMTKEIVDSLNFKGGVMGGSGKTQLILIEADQDLIPGLESRFKNAKIIQADAAKVDYTKLVPKNKSWMLIGNLPYNAGNAIIMNALASERPPLRLVVMVQKEVADRMLAKPGDMSLLSVAIQIYTKPKRLFNVGTGAFVPPPKVDSTVIELNLLDSVNRGEAEAVLKIAKAGFANRRKQLHGNLSSAKIASSERVKAVLLKIGLSESARAQELSVEEWKQVAEFIKKI
ncbi:MAG: rRNA adenine dimethyltransferase family protein, partial [Candidatus Uhrbacteria bacterium]|nr:rRNA adenine dimethyltransferase family protein [Candidatus Uhrbacteria bacterium]